MKPEGMNWRVMLRSLLSSPAFHVALLLVVCLVATVQALQTDEIANFVIFKTATGRFLAQQRLYDFIEYGIIYDKFLYSPSFALLFYPFTLLPVPVSVYLWLAAGALLFYLALSRLSLSSPQRTLVFFIALIDLVNSLQNLQTNSLNTAFMLLIFSSLQGGQVTRAGFFTALCLCIKIYPAAPALLFLFYPRKLKFLLATAGFTAFFFLLPYLVVPVNYYHETLDSWYRTLAADTDPLAIWKSPSLIGINYTWFPQTLNHFYIQIVGLLLVLLPLCKLMMPGQPDKSFLLKYLALIMIFVVIFNHAAESPTYIIAITGAGIWYAVSSRTAVHHVTLALLFAGCILLPTDLFPAWLRKEYLAPWKIRVVPVFIAWMLILYDLLRYRAKTYAAS
jgi:hypothetical protein